MIVRGALAIALIALALSMAGTAAHVRPPVAIDADDTGAQSELQGQSGIGGHGLELLQLGGHRRQLRSRQEHPDRHR